MEEEQDAIEATTTLGRWSKREATFMCIATAPKYVFFLNLIWGTKLHFYYLIFLIVVHVNNSIAWIARIGEASPNPTLGLQVRLSLKAASPRHIQEALTLVEGSSVVTIKNQSVSS
jgi:hypothetical protein